MGAAVTVVEGTGNGVMVGIGVGVGVGSGVVGRTIGFCGSTGPSAFGAVVASGSGRLHVLSDCAFASTGRLASATNGMVKEGILKRPRMTALIKALPLNRKLI